MVDHSSEDRKFPPLHAKTLLYGFRDLGVDGEGNENLLACDASFNRYSAFWVLGETLDAGYAAMEGMLRLFPKRAKDLFASSKDSILGFLASHFDRETGRFVTDSSRRTGGTFAYHAAVGVMRSLEGFPEKRLPFQTFDDYIRKIGGDPRIARRAIADLITAGRQGDGLLENPEAPLIPSVTAMYTAASLLWYLQPEKPEDGPAILRFLERPRVENFLDGCIKRQQVEERVIAGFTIHPDHSELCVNTTFFGLRLRKTLEVPLETQLAREIESFLTLSYKDGGFSSTLWEPRSLNATYLGLKALRLVMTDSGRSDRWENFIYRERKAIRGFVSSCTNLATGGSRFTPDFERYRENCLATRYRVQTLKEILRVEPSKEDEEATYRFFVGQFDEASGGFHAYPADQVDTSGFGLEELENFLKAKDRSLMSRHKERSDIALNRPEGESLVVRRPETDEWPESFWHAFGNMPDDFERPKQVRQGREALDI